MVSKDLAVVGLGNMGVSVLCAFLSRGRSCIAIDIDADKTSTLARGETLVPEEGALEIIRTALAEKRLEVSSSLIDATRAKATFIGVQTPSKGSECDYSALKRVIEDFMKIAPAGAVAVVGSTVFPGAFARELGDITARRHDVEIVYEPVFLRAGFGICDYLNPGKLIFGLRNPADPPAVLSEVFEPVIDCAPQYASYTEAEWAKMVHNAWMSAKICFANEIGELCKGFDVDGSRVMELAFAENERGRLMTTSHMKPGVPYSGPCLPKDAEILGGLVAEHGRPWQHGGVLDALKSSNDRFRESLVQEWLGAGRAAGKPLGIIGVSFRPDFNEMRFSIALDFIRAAQAEGLELLAYDPMFSGISRDEYVLACRQDRFLESLFEVVTLPLDRVWSECGAVFINRKLGPEELNTILKTGKSPRVLDIYVNHLGEAL